MAVRPKPPTLPKQPQAAKPGRQAARKPQPLTTAPQYHPAGKLKGKVALITGADSGIGRAVALAFAREGADIAFCYLEEDADAAETERLLAEVGQRCLALRGDVGKEK